MIWEEKGGKLHWSAVIFLSGVIYCGHAPLQLQLQQIIFSDGDSYRLSIEIKLINLIINLNLRAVDLLGATVDREELL